MSLSSHQQEVLKTYSIKTTSQLVALNSHTIRAWERRYKALDPTRNESNNRRVYSPADIDRLLTLSKLVKGGHIIGHIACLSTDQLKSMLLSHETSASDAVLSNQTEDNSVIDQCWHSLLANNFLQFKCEIESAREDHSTPNFLSLTVMPLLKKLEDAKLTMELGSPQVALAFDIIKTMLFEKSLEMQISSHICRQPTNGSRDDKIICLIPNFTDFSISRMHALGTLLAAQGYVPYVIDTKNSAESVSEFVHSINTNFIIIDAPEVENASVYYQDFLKTFLRLIPAKCTVWQFATDDTNFKSKSNTSSRKSIQAGQGQIDTVDFQNVSQTIENQLGKLLRMTRKPRGYLPN